MTEKPPRPRGLPHVHAVQAFDVPLQVDLIVSKARTGRPEVISSSRSTPALGVDGKARRVSGPMEYSLTPSADGRYIIITVTGDFTRAEAAKITAEAFAMGDTLGIHCYLNDVTKARNIESTLENVHFAKEDRPGSPPYPEACTALVLDPRDHSHDFYIAFAQTVGIDITPFWDRDEAIAHLLKVSSRSDTDKSP